MYKMFDEFDTFYFKNTLKDNWKKFDICTVRILKSIYDIITVLPLSFPRLLISNSIKPRASCISNKIPRQPISPPPESKPSDYVRQTKYSPRPNENKPFHSHSTEINVQKASLHQLYYIVYSIQVYSRKLAKSTLWKVKRNPMTTARMYMYVRTCVYRPYCINYENRE